jgi:hypothetical protein
MQVRDRARDQRKQRHAANRGPADLPSAPAFTGSPGDELTGDRGYVRKKVSEGYAHPETNLCSPVSSQLGAGRERGRHHAAVKIAPLN